jgi:hypothetical protein
MRHTTSGITQSISDEQMFPTTPKRENKSCIVSLSEPTESEKVNSSAFITSRSSVPHRYVKTLGFYQLRISFLDDTQNLQISILTITWKPFSVLNCPSTIQVESLSMLFYATPNRVCCQNHVQIRAYIFF